jgi:SAM-dependent methyltransferase
MGGMPAQWQSYDSAATTHQLAVPRMFAAPARDLVARMNLPGAARVLDVGSGTGVAATLAMEAAGPQAIVVGLDLSIGMLRTARENGITRVAVGALPHLPFAACFDAVMASFVLSHIADCPGALREMARVLKPGGRLGATAWGPTSNPYRDLWDKLCEEVVDRDRLRGAASQALPWEERLTDAPTFAGLLSEAGLGSIEIQRMDYSMPMTIDDYLAIRSGSLQSRFMRGVLGEEAWGRFVESATAEFHRRFQDPIDHARDALIATGTV